MRKMTRREWLRMTALTSASVAVAACTAPPATTEAPPAEVATSAPAPTTAPAKPTATTAPVAPAATVTPPVPYPDPNNIGVGGGEVKRIPIDQLVTYKSMPAYKQPAWLDKFVTDGTLPPVEKRLPKEPAVYLKTGMKDGVGVYGDLWPGFSACPTAGYNDIAGTTMGWFGIESY
nr:hypothetical protein [Anaerolinea sp.]